MTENEEVIRHYWVVLALLLASCATLHRDAGDEYLDRYFATFPSRATTAGRHEHDGQLERFDASDRAAWIAFNEQMKARHASDRLDDLLLQRHIDRETYRFKVLRVPERNPLFWTEIVGNSLVFLLLREQPIAMANARAGQIPALVANAEAALTDPTQIAPELCAIAAAQARASAKFFRSGFAMVGDQVIAVRAANATDQFASFLEDLQKRASGTPRLGTAYAENLRLATGVTDVDALLAQAERDLAAKKVEAEALAAPLSLREAFDRLEADHAKSEDEWVLYGTRLVDEAEDFTKAHDVVTLPEPRTLLVGRSPAYFVGQSVGGVYPAGPYEPEAKTLYFLPMPSSPATAEAFYRDFNDHFQRMITPHEILPGHYVQLKYAARNEHKIRAMFPDDVYVEGWGTFCERLMLDLGWGGPLDRLAHLKKQMENIARTIVDIRVHTKGMTKEEVMRFVREDALQGEQLARNMWTRTITTSPQITYYYLGYNAVRGIYENVRAARGASFRLREFNDQLMRIGPVPPSELQRILLELPHAETNPPRG
jgi:uncharacterized protein (DUF885 family)